MTPLALVKDFDVFLDGRFRVFPRGVHLMMDHFVLQATRVLDFGRLELVAHLVIGEVGHEELIFIRKLYEDWHGPLVECKLMCRFHVVVQAYLSSRASLCVAEIRKCLILLKAQCKLMCRPTGVGPARHCSAPLRQEVPRQGMIGRQAGASRPGQPAPPDGWRAVQAAFCAVHRIFAVAASLLCYLAIDSTAAAARQPAFFLP